MCSKDTGLRARGLLASRFHSQRKWMGGGTYVIIYEASIESSL